jgi:acylphosphatase
MTTQQRARELGLACRAWNRDDGAMECTADGEPAALDELERWLHRGPSLARVESVERVAG